MTPAKLRTIADPTKRARAAQAALLRAQSQIIELHEIRAAAVTEMRAAGMSHGDVAKALGISRARAADLAAGR